MEKENLFPAPDVAVLPSQSGPLGDLQARERGLLAEVEARYAALHRQLEESFIQKEKKLIEGLQVQHAAECKRLKKESAQGEKNLLLELEAKHEVFLKDLELSFSARERKFAADLQAATDRERVLADNLQAARMQLVLVILGVILAVVVYFNMKSLPQPTAQAPLPAAPNAVEVNVPQAKEASLPVVVASGQPEVKKVAAAQAVTEAPSAVPAKTGNGGNFSGGNFR